MYVYISYLSLGMQMANYFISVLVPMLYQSGYGYQLLRSMLSARLLEQAQNTGQVATSLLVLYTYVCTICTLSLGNMYEVCMCKYVEVCIHTYIHTIHCMYVCI